MVDIVDEIMIPKRSTPLSIIMLILLLAIPVMLTSLFSMAQKADDCLTTPATEVHAGHKCP